MPEGFALAVLAVDAARTSSGLTDMRRFADATACTADPPPATRPGYGVSIEGNVSAHGVALALGSKIRPNSRH